MMSKVTPVNLSRQSLLSASAERPGSYADCFEGVVRLDRCPEAAFQRFVFLFFDSSVFRVERRLLKLIGKAPGHYTDAMALAQGRTDRFAAWVVEGRRPTELLLAVPGTPIRTWLALDHEGQHGRLCFGSAILAPQGRPKIHWAVRATFGAHRLYSRLLLRSAVSDCHKGKDLPPRSPSQTSM